MASTVVRLGRITNLVHGFIYFSSEASERYAAVGLTGRQQYFAGRAAAMGEVGADVVVSTFYNFNPQVVHAAIPSAWQVATAADIQQARFEAVADVLDPFSGELDAANIDRAIEIAAAMVAGVTDEDKPLAAGNRAIELPQNPLLHLWQLVTIIREWRGDAHVNALREAEVSGVQALVLHAATGEVPTAVLKATRAWSDDDWTATIASLEARELVTADGSFTTSGRELREAIEATTNTAAQALVDAVGDDNAVELYELLKPVRTQLMASGVFTKPLGGNS